MPLSSSTLIHFTNNKDALLGILRENFKIYPCVETVKLGPHKHQFIAPIVSFCDIPLSQVKDHIGKYGSYGIGMTKKWGNRMGLNPVLYVSPNSSLSKSFELALSTYAPHTLQYEDSTEQQKAVIDLLRFTKNYEGDLIRKGKLQKADYRFSDEREWRYAPPADECVMMSSVSSYKTRKKQLDKAFESLRLRFEPDDIKYIIIKDDSEIREFIDHLRDVKGKNYSLHDIERLTTRILTTEQIMSDI